MAGRRAFRPAAFSLFETWSDAQSFARSGVGRDLLPIVQIVDECGTAYLRALARRITPEAGSDYVISVCRRLRRRCGSCETGTMPAYDSGASVSLNTSRFI